MGLARPLETFFGHGAVFRGRFHEIAPNPKQQGQRALHGRAPAESASARGDLWAEDRRDEQFLGMDLIDPARRHKTHYQILSATHLKV
jgi:hypothetical protein